MSKKNKLFCDVKIGVNTCDICCEKAYFSKRIPQPNHKSYPKMSLLRCGHGMCECCLAKHVCHNGFSCPFCRSESVGIMKQFGSSEIKGTMDCFDDFIYEWRNYIGRALSSEHKFARLYRTMLDDYNVEKSKKRFDKIKEKKRLDKIEQTKKRAKSRNKAICPHCGKNSFTSEKQRDYHIMKKHQ